jgi:hypothetical protein
VIVVTRCTRYTGSAVRGGTGGALGLVLLDLAGLGDAVWALGGGRRGTERQNDRSRCAGSDVTWGLMNCGAREKNQEVQYEEKESTGLEAAEKN